MFSKASIQGNDLVASCLWKKSSKGCGSVFPSKNRETMLCWCSQQNRFTKKKHIYRCMSMHFELFAYTAVKSAYEKSFPSHGIKVSAEAVTTKDYLIFVRWLMHREQIANCTNLPCDEASLLWKQAQFNSLKKRELRVLPLIHSQELHHLSPPFE